MRTGRGQLRLQVDGGVDVTAVRRVSYDFAVAAAAPPSWRALRDAIGLDDLRARGPTSRPDDAWPAGGLSLCRVGRSTRTTEVDWRDGKLTIVIRALPSPDDCDLALRVAEAAARLAGRRHRSRPTTSAPSSSASCAACTPPTGCTSKRFRERASSRR